MKNLAIFLLSAWALISCYAYELKLEDPIFDFKHEGIKRILVLPFEGDKDLSEQSKNLLAKTHLYFTQNLRDLKTVEIIDHKTVQPLLSHYQSPFWDLPSAFIQQLGQTSQADLIITGKLKFPKGSPGFFKAKDKKPENELVTNQLYLESELAVQFWDAQEGKVVLLQHTSYGDKAALHGLELLMERTASQLSQQITKSIKPYYVYK